MHILPSDVTNSIINCLDLYSLRSFSAVSNQTNALTTRSLKYCRSFLSTYSYKGVPKDIVLLELIRSRMKNIFMNIANQELVLDKPLIIHGKQLDFFRDTVVPNSQLTLPIKLVLKDIKDIRCANNNKSFLPVVQTVQYSTEHFDHYGESDPEFGDDGNGEWKKVNAANRENLDTQQRQFLVLLHEMTGAQKLIICSRIPPHDMTVSYPSIKELQIYNDPDTDDPDTAMLNSYFAETKFMDSENPRKLITYFPNLEKFNNKQIATFLEEVNTEYAFATFYNHNKVKNDFPDSDSFEIIVEGIQKMHLSEPFPVSQTVRKIFASSCNIQ